MFRRKKGITLIALIITIIILLILAGVAIAALTGDNGLFSRAKKSRTEMFEAQNKENMILGDYENKIEKYVDGSREINPSGTINITENGQYNVTEYANANVNISTQKPGEIISYVGADKDDFTSTYTATKDCVVLATSIAMHNMTGTVNGYSSTNQTSSGIIISEVSEMRTTMPTQYIQRLYKLSEGQYIQCISSAYQWGKMCHTFLVY